ncbi:ATP-binding protein [Pelotalea chapellei]|uniref:ATP-binding protein n=1 Tax=Pelotalea chapellei TaxID=44671 RepID=UPI001FECE5DB|nr:ATP-binding protein [Pelotalea chapellei]
MKTLSKAIMIQWFRLQAVEIPIVGNTAIIGDNGAGKSALLDAIQTVMTGANKRYLVLNRGSNETSSRKVWEYVLGLLSDPKDPELSAKIKPRDKANCFLALNFYDYETNETTCVGLGLYASMADMAEKVEGYFICPGLVGKKDLFLDPGEGTRPIVLPWARVKERLAKACPATRFHHEPGKFTADLYTTLSEHAGAPNDDKKVLKAVQAAVSLDKIENPTQFIRKYMLDRDDLQIKELQSALKNYRDMAEKADSVSRRVNALGRLEGFCEKVEAGNVEQVMGEYIDLCAHIELVEEGADPVREAMADLEEKKEELGLRVGGLEKKRDELLGILGERRSELKNSDLENQRRSLQLDINQNKTIESEAGAKISGLRRLLQRLEKLKMIPSTEALSAAIADVARVLPSEDMVSTAMWPEKPVELDGALANMRISLEKALPLLSSRYNGLCGDIASVIKVERDLTGSLKQVQHGKAPLTSSTLGLIQFLKERGIEAKPLCDLVDLTNETWRNTIESILGHKREALVVIPEQVKKAVNLYRHEGRRDFPGCSIINTTKTDQYKDARKKGSVAEHLTTDNLHAQAFINRQLGNFICVETEKDLLSHDRAATADGMISTGGLVSETKTLSPILGRASRELLKETYQKKLREIGGKKEALERDQQQLDSLKVVLEEYKRDYTENSFSTEAVVSRRTSAQQTLKVLEARLAELALDTREKNLTKEIERLDKEEASLKGEIGRLSEERKQAERLRAERKSFSCLGTTAS